MIEVSINICAGFDGLSIEQIDAEIDDLKAGLYVVIRERLGELLQLRNKLMQQELEEMRLHRLVMFCQTGI